MVKFAIIFLFLDQRKGMIKVSEKNCDNCFEPFRRNSPKKKEPTLQALIDYRESYMKLLKKYQPEVKFIQEMIEKNESEIKEFYTVTLSEVSHKLCNDLAIDAEMRSLWLRRFESNISKSFELSQKLVEDFAIKNIDEFQKEAEEILKRM